MNEKPLLPKCKCDKYIVSKGYHFSWCKYAIESNKKLKEEMGLPDILTLDRDIHVDYSNWSKKRGEKVEVTYDIRKGYFGKRSDMYYAPTVRAVKIKDCDYPVVWFPETFKELKKP